MPFVVDASVTLAWCFEDEASPHTDAILDLLSDDTAVVPSLWELEVSNVLLLGERSRRLTESQTARFVALLGQLPILVDSASVTMEAVLAVGGHHALTAYDAAYLVLAEREGVPLATLDTKLRNAARAVGVQLIPETEQAATDDA
ncbi:MAG TPA: type II toxin-antitoxin system VapC family toxin [Streptosporangiaceae bacterium]|nr:type II toxin-antitoxin system VapC family toxin [Streptosporangiaceae bacterium]